MLDPLPVAVLPPLLGSVRRGRLLAADGANRTWEGWDTEGAARVLVQTGPTLEACGGGLRWSRRESPLPHLVSEPLLGMLSEREPLEPGEGAQLAMPVALAGVRDLCALHAVGVVHGDVGVHSFVLAAREGGARWVLGRWAHASGTPGARPETDWRALGTLVAHLGEGLDVETFARWPPRDPHEAWARVRAALPRELAAARHALRRRARRSAGALARARLRDLTERLGAASIPPTYSARIETIDGRSFALRSGPGRFEVDDGTRTRIVWHRDPEGGGVLDVGAARALLRAVGRSAARPAMRWIVAALKLHTERVVLEGAP
jgi:hypothetical protein